MSRWKFPQEFYPYIQGQYVRIPIHAGRSLKALRIIAEAWCDLRHFDKIKDIAFGLCGRKPGYLGYAYTTVPQPNGKRKTIQLHNLLFGHKSSRRGRVLDHQNGNTLDNTDGNLKLKTVSGNQLNKTVKSSSPYRNLRRTASGNWEVSVGLGPHHKRPDGRSRTGSFGTYSNVQDAKRIADIVLTFVWGDTEVPRLHIPEENSLLHLPRLMAKYETFNKSLLRWFPDLIPAYGSEPLEDDDVRSAPITQQAASL